MYVNYIIFLIRKLKNSQFLILYPNFDRDEAKARSVQHIQTVDQMLEALIKEQSAKGKGLNVKQIMDEFEGPVTEEMKEQ